MVDYTQFLPPMKMGEELVGVLASYPPYDVSIQKAPAKTRLTSLDNLYTLYIPAQMSVEIYHKLYTALLCSMRKKGTKTAVQQQYQNYFAIRGLEYNSIIGGADSFTILGASGIGKSMAVSRAISQINQNHIIEIKEPFTKIVPCLIVQCPFDASVKGLLLEILRKIDEVLGSDYYSFGAHTRVTTDTLIGAVSQAALNHVGLLVVDEIQNVVHNKHGKNLIGALTQLINNSGISVGMIGTPECRQFFESAPQLARRSVGLQYGPMEYDEYFTAFCQVLFGYQYTRSAIPLTNTVTEWLYTHSAGIASTVVSLIHDAQEIAILSERDILDLDSLQSAYQQRLAILHNYIVPSIKRLPNAKSARSCAQQAVSPALQANNEDITVTKLLEKAKQEQLDMICLLKEYFPLIEVAV